MNNNIVAFSGPAHLLLARNDHSDIHVPVFMLVNGHLVSSNTTHTRVNNDLQMHKTT